MYTLGKAGKPAGNPDVACQWLGSVALENKDSVSVSFFALHAANNHFTLAKTPQSFYPLVETQCKL